MLRFTLTMWLGPIIVLALLGGIAALLGGFARTRRAGRVLWAVIVAGFLYLLSTHIRRAVGYAHVQRGDTRAQILLRLGHPEFAGEPWPYIGWDTDESLHKNNGECVEEFRYYAPFTVRCWWVGFDRDGRVNSKYTAVSY